MTPLAQALTFAVSQFTTRPQRFIDDLDLYERLNVRQIEIVEDKLDDDPARAMEQLSALRERGFTPTSFQPAVHAVFTDQTSPEPKDPDQRAARFHQSIDRVADAFPSMQTPLVTVTGLAPDGNFRRAHETAVRIYRELAEHAAQREVRLAFEPLHPVLMNQDTFICTLHDAVEMVEAVDREAFGLTLDLWHLWHEPMLEQRLRPVGDRLFVLHFADWPAAKPRHMNDRLIPGSGSLDLRHLFETVVNAGYAGPACLEILSDEGLPDSLWRADPADVIARSRDAFDRIVR